MEYERIDSTDHPLFERMWDIYRSSFPAHEQRSREGQEAAFRHPAYRVDAFTENGVPVGFLAWWDLDGPIYIDHFATDRERRGNGLGERVLRKFLAEHPGTVVLDIDPLTDDISARRKGFYERIGFRANPHRHLHPPYQREGEPFELILMSFPGELDPEAYRDFYRKFERVVAVGR